VTILDEAKSLVERFPPEATAAEIARAVGQKASWVRTRLRLLMMHPQIQQAAQNGLITEKQVKLLGDTIRLEHRHRKFREMMGVE
jgi:hypothetical protein